LTLFLHKAFRASPSSQLDSNTSAKKRKGETRLSLPLFHTLFSAFITWSFIGVIVLLREPRRCQLQRCSSRDAWFSRGSPVKKTSCDA